MIKVIVTKNSIIISGHANFDEYGKDIVCASVSTMVTTSVNDMMSINQKALSYNDDGKRIVIQLKKYDELVLKLFRNLIHLLKNLAEDYPQNIKIESEE